MRQGVASSRSGDRLYNHGHVRDMLLTGKRQAYKKTWMDVFIIVKLKPGKYKSGRILFCSEYGKNLERDKLLDNRQVFFTVVFI